MDPREYGPQQRRANLSELMAAQMRASKGEKVNFCMFGCDDSDLDDNGYCRHVVGFTKDGKVMEPFLPPDGSGRRKVLGSRPEPILPGDKLVRITTDSRVYREQPPLPDQLTEDDLELATRPGGNDVG
jgi:hypothetical protein